MTPAVDVVHTSSNILHAYDYFVCSSVNEVSAKGDVKDKTEVDMGNVLYVKYLTKETFTYWGNLMVLESIR